MSDNPFILEPYKSPFHFCDREKETEEIIRNITNGRNTTLISPRRLGKTGLIFRVFDEMKSRKLPFETIYCDISDTFSIEAFVKVISDAVVGKLGNQKTIMSFIKTIKSVRPLLSIAPLTGSPQVSFTFANEEQKQGTLKEILDYLENYPHNVVLAIDEFQQIREYGEVNMEAILRKHIQHLHNVRFIYCGSKKHTMSDMFTNAKKPFYESTPFIYLSKISVPLYAAFIKNLFASAGKIIDEDDVKYIIEWTKDYTYYTQRLCNEVFSLSDHHIAHSDILAAIQSIFDAERDRFQEIRRLITRAQWKMLVAIAIEGNISQITSSAFLSKYHISSGATALRNIKSLIDKELILETTTNGETSYAVYNVFLSRFLENVQQ